MDVEVAHGWQRSVTFVYSDLDRPPLHAVELERALVTSGSTWTSVEVLPEVGSTNAYLQSAAADPASTGRVVIAEHQVAGRGRLDRGWEAPPRSGLTMSVLVRPDGVAAGRWPWLPLVAGLAVAAAVRRDGAVEAVLKWPNDVLVEDRKLAGILVERVEAAGQPPAAVVGIGLNVSLRADERPTDHATSMALEGAATTDRTQLAKAVLRTLDGLYQQWTEAAGDPDAGLRTAYLQACGTIGRRVRVSLPGGRDVVGTARDIDEGGRLVLATGHGETVVGAGDVLYLREQA
jgi:BirA family biotin operon repressor/biotin-[acetyl-CoA-carboxylase] ligase